MGRGHLSLPGSLLGQSKHPGQARAHAQLIRTLHGRDLLQQVIHIPVKGILIHVQAFQDKFEKPVRLAAHGGQQMHRAQLLMVVHHGLLLGCLQ